MAPKIGQPSSTPLWPWGGPGAVREKLVERGQLNKKSARKKGDPKNPALASAALLDFIGPAHTADELRLPMPPLPVGHESDLEGFAGRAPLQAAAERLGADARAAIERGLTAVRASPERMERLRALLQREAKMLELVARVSWDVTEIERRRREATSGEVA